MKLKMIGKQKTLRKVMVLISCWTLRFGGRISENWPQRNECAFDRNRTFVVKNAIVRLLMGSHSNADNKFKDDYKTNISFGGKNESKKRIQKRLGML